ncbi:transthyretin-like family protein [Calycomorphotria hydatis]|nr:carboxypeptidase-like regulatory domain-containing protein [Calycomorphotria hydatis]
MKFAFLVVVVSLLAGCNADEGPDLGTVTGTVTLDGEPLPNAEVVFSPVLSGRSSFATTDQDGHYEMLYTSSRKGATWGEHRVSITTAVEEFSNEATGELTPAVKEKLPAKYHEKTELSANVESGSNTIDFALKSE